VISIPWKYCSLLRRKALTLAVQTHVELLWSIGCNIETDQMGEQREKLCTVKALYFWQGPYVFSPPTTSGHTAKIKAFLLRKRQYMLQCRNQYLSSITHLHRFSQMVHVFPVGHIALWHDDNATGAVFLWHMLLFVWQTDKWTVMGESVSFTVLSHHRIGNNSLLKMYMFKWSAHLVCVVPVTSLNLFCVWKQFYPCSVYIICCLSELLLYLWYF
jgi:hypothetical protein